MDLLDLNQLGFSGYTLNVEERAGLEVAVNKKKLEDGLAELLFWGKIYGEEDDYVVLFGYGESQDFPRKRFYFSTTKSLALTPFPEMTEEFTKLSSGVSGRFKGNPSFKFGEEEEEEEEVDEDGQPKPKKIKFSEAHRLAYTVGRMDSELAVVPRGAYVVTATHYIVRNSGFGGLTPTEAGDLTNYFHFRAPVNLGRKTVLERRGLVASTDFLDPLAEDLPIASAAWSVRVDKARGSAYLKSLLYPGYFFYHNTGSARFGGAYFGDGVRNDDIGFMV